MSNQPRSTSVGGTLTGGIQDVSAILPLIGTEQCEKHVGSALTGGYLYAAAAPLSVFGCLGIVKAGMSVLISSIAISVPNVSISCQHLKLSFGYSPQQPIWFGARFLNNAGYDLPGTVAPLMGMDGQRFKAETRIVEILEEKKFDDPENLSVRWKSRQWNLMLVVSTIVAAFMSALPYIALLLGPSSWRPHTPLPWLFPILRTGGSCLVAVCTQFVIQSRVISLMKNRILFMAVYKRFIRGVSKDDKDGLDRWLKDTLKWDASRSVEQSFWNLGQFLSSGGLSTLPGEDPNDTKDHISLPMATPSTTPPPPFDENFSFTHHEFRRMHQQHFPSPIRDLALSFLLRIILLLSLPATVAGYVGCFTLVNSTPSGGNGPLVWLMLEAALTILRIVVWASNPRFDEDIAIEVWMKFTQDDHEPLVTTQDPTAFIYDAEIDSTKTWALLPEREFIDHITPYTGPLDQFRKPENIALYFTLTSDHGMDLGTSFERRDRTKESEGSSDRRTECLSLLLTVINYNTQLSVTLVLSAGSFYYFDVDLKLETISTRMEARANLQSPRRKFHRWRTEDDIFFDSLQKYYLYIIDTFGQKMPTGKCK